jgi:hypothetical protein
MIDEVYRIRHIATGKFLAVADDKQEIILKNTANSLSTLFIIKSDMQTKNTMRYDEQDMVNPSEQTYLKSHQRVMI